MLFRVLKKTKLSTSDFILDFGLTAATTCTCRKDEAKSNCIQLDTQRSKLASQSNALSLQTELRKATILKKNDRSPVVAQVRLTTASLTSWHAKTQLQNVLLQDCKVLNTNSDDDDNDESDERSSSSPDESSAEVVESESSDSVQQPARRPNNQIRHKPSVSKNIATRNKVYNEDKHMKPDRPKAVPRTMRRGFDEIHYMRTRGTGYATERDDLKYMNEDRAESSDESAHSSDSAEQSHKSGSRSDSDEAVDEKLEQLNEGIKGNIKEV